MFLTHQDDVADHAKWAARFGCERIIHEDDVSNFFWSRDDRALDEALKKFDNNFAFGFTVDRRRAPVTSGFVRIP